MKISDIIIFWDALANIMIFSKTQNKSQECPTKTNILNILEMIIGTFFDKLFIFECLLYWKWAKLPGTSSDAAILSFCETSLGDLYLCASYVISVLTDIISCIVTLSVHHALTVLNIILNMNGVCWQRGFLGTLQTFEALAGYWLSW